MGCPKCEDHSAHEVILAQHEKRHDAHDSSTIDLWAAVKLKVSRWIFVILLGIVRIVPRRIRYTFRDIFILLPLLHLSPSGRPGSW